MTNTLSSQLLYDWVGRHLTEKPLTIIPLVGGWSDRRIYRVTTPTKTLILVDSSAELVGLKDFVVIDQALARNQVDVPEIMAVDFELGYLLETDFGDVSLFSQLSADNSSHWYRRVVDELARIQKCQPPKEYSLSRFDAEHCRIEWKLFTKHYLQERHHVLLDPYHCRLQDVWSLLFATMQEQPQVFVHRDYHSQNLMVLPDEKLGVIDFQSAKWGPITYDLVSLLKDCYLDWPTDQVHEWLKEFQPLLWAATDLPAVHLQQFRRWFDLTGLQRHLKVLGQMARNIRTDPNFPNAKDLPRVERYVLDVCARYPELSELSKLLENLIEPNK
ncbi:MAG: aminoglycoside phosphotransferase [Gammaproteobacteria bacterium]|nr:aminoglycoside phosphotransferase [Gammaproteobacteria bacterium]